MLLDRLISLGPLDFQGENATVSRVLAESGLCLIQKRGATSREAEVVTALAAYQPLVPAFLGADAHALYFSEIPGQNLAERFAHATQKRDTLASVLGRVLKQVHTWTPPLESSPQPWREIALEHTKASAQKYGETPISLSHSPFVGQSYASLATWVEQESPTIATALTFCHGDACLPNFLTKEGTITGIVDWGDGGWADPRFDLATTLWSLRRNDASDCQEHFLTGYGWAGGIESLRFFEALYTLWD